MENNKKLENQYQCKTRKKPKILFKMDIKTKPYVTQKMIKIQFQYIEVK